MLYDFQDKIIKICLQIKIFYQTKSKVIKDCRVVIKHANEWVNEWYDDLLGSEYK